MRSRWSESAFRPDPSSGPQARPLRAQSISLLAVLVLVAGAVAAAGYLVRPDRARSYELLHGSIFLADQVAPVGIDLASGKPTLRLVGAEKQVGARSPSELAVVPTDDGTLLLDRASGQFNMVDTTGFVIKHDNGGVPLPPRSDTTASTGIAAGSSAYVERTGPAGTDVYLVDQLTVQAATNLRQRVAPRASTRVREVGSTAPGASAAVDGSLWALLGTGTTRTVHEFSVPADAARGARLRDAGRGNVDGPAAIGTAGDSGVPTTPAAAGTSAASPGPSAVTGDAALGVASAGGIRYFGASVPQFGREVRYRTQSDVRGLDTVLAATSASTRLVFLLHGSAGWSVVSLAADGSDLRGPTVIPGIPADADLAAPAMSNGDAYTVDRTSRALYRIDISGNATAVTGARHYPLAERDGHVAESADVDDAYVTARGPRVFVDSPSHVDAVALFTDGSHPPLVVQKSAAVDVSAAAGAQALAQTDVGTVRTGNPNQSRPKNAAEAINNKVDCRTVTQKPHIPVITQATPGSRTVALAWDYPLLDSQDCAPSTYVVSVALESGNAPTPAGSATVLGQQSTDLTGLFPQTRYKLTVTAYLHGQGTSSAPIQVITGKEGPAAPTDVSVTADSSGNWHVSFKSCGTVAQGCVAAASWRVVPSFCDGRGLAAPPAAIVSPADPTSTTQPPVTVPGADDLLGRGLRFQVEGDGTGGELGTPSAPSACVYSWTPPVGPDITLSASAPPRTDSNGTTDTTASVHFARGQIHDLGGVGGTLTYQLLSGGEVVATSGPTSASTVSLGGVRAGQSYSVKLIATAPRHPEATTTVGPVPVAPAIADWPTPSVNTAFRTTSAAKGDLDVTVSFPAGTSTRGETFDLVNSSLTCGSTSEPLQHDDFSPGDTLTFADISRFDFASSDCAVTVQLAQDSRTVTTPSMFGAGNSPQARSATFTIPDPGSTTNADDFSAVWSGDQTHPQITLSYDDSNADPETFTTDWHSTVTNGSTDDCGTSGDAPTVTIDVSPGCVSDGGSFTVQVSYSFFGTTRNFTVDVTGTAPQPVDPADVSFSPAWDTSAPPTVDVSYTGSANRSELAPFTFTETITSNTQVDPNVDCADAHDNPADGDPMQIPVDLSACPPLDTDGSPAKYEVRVQYVDDTYDRTFDKSYPVSGVPPS